MTMSQKIINLRERKGWRPRELAKRTNLDFSVMNCIEPIVKLYESKQDIPFWKWMIQSLEKSS
ncbi:hypothetical protein GCM10007968_17330 [Sporolactobacillus putidus]|uniref:Uncharacterized protein n=1 Tax=Sporolactobacillus putidus TaxID=492735 RepID=A0A917S3Z4_9BACL|nr:hypothetical protein GCM10007968_17330 [Sporolactobacillus putidus]